MIQLLFREWFYGLLVEGYKEATAKFLKDNPNESEVTNYINNFRIVSKLKMFPAENIEIANVPATQRNSVDSYKNLSQVIELFKWLKINKQLVEKIDKFSYLLAKERYALTATNVDLDGLINIFKQAVQNSNPIIMADHETVKVSKNVDPITNKSFRQLINSYDWKNFEAITDLLTKDSGKEKIATSDAKKIYPVGEEAGDGLEIFYSPTAQGCIEIKGDHPTSWCVARKQGNLYGHYRMGARYNQPAFYFVKNIKKFAKEYASGEPQHPRYIDPWHFFVIQVPVNANINNPNQLYLVTDAINAGDYPLTWSEIARKEPLLNGKQQLFKPVGFSKAEKSINELRSGNLSVETFSEFNTEEKKQAISTIVTNKSYLNKEIYDVLSKELLNYYIRLRPNLPEDQLVSLRTQNPKFFNEYLGLIADSNHPEHSIIAMAKADASFDYIDAFSKIIPESKFKSLLLKVTSSNPELLTGEMLQKYIDTLLNSSVIDLDIMDLNNIVKIIKRNNEIAGKIAQKRSDLLLLAIASDNNELLSKRLTYMIDKFVDEKTYIKIAEEILDKLSSGYVFPGDMSNGIGRSFLDLFCPHNNYKNRFNINLFDYAKEKYPIKLNNALTAVINYARDDDATISSALNRIKKQDDKFYEKLIRSNFEACKDYSSNKQLHGFAPKNLVSKSCIFAVKLLKLESFSHLEEIIRIVGEYTLETILKNASPNDFSFKDVDFFSKMPEGKKYADVLQEKLLEDPKTMLKHIADFKTFVDQPIKFQKEALKKPINLLYMQVFSTVYPGMPDSKINNLINLLKNDKDILRDHIKGLAKIISEKAYDENDFYFSFFPAENQEDRDYQDFKGIMDVKKAIRQIFFLMEIGVISFPKLLNYVNINVALIILACMSPSEKTVGYLNDLAPYIKNVSIVVLMSFLVQGISSPFGMYKKKSRQAYNLMPFVKAILPLIFDRKNLISNLNSITHVLPSLIVIDPSIYTTYINKDYFSSEQLKNIHNELSNSWAFKDFMANMRFKDHELYKKIRARILGKSEDEVSFNTMTTSQEIEKLLNKEKVDSEISTDDYKYVALNTIYQAPQSKQLELAEKLQPLLNELTPEDYNKPMPYSLYSIDQFMKRPDGRYDYPRQRGESIKYLVDSFLTSNEFKINRSEELPCTQFGYYLILALMTKMVPENTKQKIIELSKACQELTKKNG